MARAISEYVQVLCPTLATSASYAIYVELATDDTSLSFFSDKYYNYAIALRAAHNFTLDNRGTQGDGGLITSKQEGKIQVSYLHNMNRMSRSDLLMTIYGQKLQALIRSRGPMASISSTEFDLDSNIFVEVDEDFI